MSHAGVGLLRELADLTGLSSQVTVALADTYGCTRLEMRLLIWPPQWPTVRTASPSTARIDER